VRCSAEQAATSSATRPSSTPNDSDRQQGRRGCPRAALFAFV
jgi:hypothetical protein